MKPQKRPNRKNKIAELTTLCVYAAWLIASICLWKTKWMEPYKISTGISLFFSGLVIFLLNCIRGLPQLRLVKASLTAAQTAATFRLRVYWIAEMKLLITCGLAASTLSLLSGNLLRSIVVWVFLILVGLSFARFFMRGRAIARSKHAPRRRPRASHSTTRG